MCHQSLDTLINLRHWWLSLHEIRASIFYQNWLSEHPFFFHPSGSPNQKRKSGLYVLHKLYTIKILSIWHELLGKSGLKINGHLPICQFTPRKRNIQGKNMAKMCDLWQMQQIQTRDPVRRKTHLHSLWLKIWMLLIQRNKLCWNKIIFLFTNRKYCVIIHLWVN